MNMICLDGRTMIPPVAGNLVKAFLAAEFNEADRHRRRLEKVAELEASAAG